MLTKCNICGSSDSIIRWGKYDSSKGVFQRYKCNDCLRFQIGERLGNTIKYKVVKQAGRPKKIKVRGFK